MNLAQLGENSSRVTANDKISTFSSRVYVCIAEQIHLIFLIYILIYGDNWKRRKIHKRSLFKLSLESVCDWTPNDVYAFGAWAITNTVNPSLQIFRIEWLELEMLYQISALADIGLLKNQYLQHKLHFFAYSILQWCLRKQVFLRLSITFFSRKKVVSSGNWRVNWYSRCY